MRQFIQKFLEITDKKYLKISMDNILNEDYQKSIGFNDNGRNINISYKLSF